MHKSRLEAFSDGVIAIIITIMVLELRPPTGADLQALAELLPVFLSYIMSFVFIGIYWNNHHHLLQATKNVTGGILWSNLHLLFWLSFIPFTTRWMGEHWQSPWPVAAYGVILFFSGAAYSILAHCLIAIHGNDSLLKSSIGSDRKGYVSVVAYALAIPCAFWSVTISYGLYAFVAVLWLVPDRRIEKNFRRESQ